MSDGQDRAPRLWLVMPPAYKGTQKLVAMRLITAEEYESGELPAGEDSVFGKLSGRYLKGAPGTVYEIETKGDCSAITPASAKLYGLWPDAQQRANWQAEWRAREQEVRAAKERAKREAHDDLEEHLAALREAYISARGQWRPQLLAYMVSRITK